MTDDKINLFQMRAQSGQLIWASGALPNEPGLTATWSTSKPTLEELKGVHGAVTWDSFRVVKWEE